MHKNNYIGVAIDELIRVFEALNEEYFNGELTVPMLTIQRNSRSSKVATMGWMSTERVWVNKETGEVDYETNICPEFLNLPVDDIAGVLQHEMVHYWNITHEIKDCSGKKHNKKFVQLAESKDLIVTSNDTKGCHTDPSPKLRAFITDVIKPNEECFKYFRQIIVKEKKEPKKTMFKYKCPKCGENIKAKEEAKVKCGKCDCDFEIDE